MSMLTAAGTTVVSSPLLLPARRVGCKRQSRLMKSGLGRVCYQFQPLPTKCAPVKSLKLGPVRFGTHSVLMETRKSAMFSTRRHSSAFICAAAFSATCAAVQTQTVTRQAPTITHLPEFDPRVWLDFSDPKWDRARNQLHGLVDHCLDPSLQRRRPGLGSYREQNGHYHADVSLRGRSKPASCQ